MRSEIFEETIVFSSLQNEKRSMITSTVTIPTQCIPSEQRGSRCSNGIFKAHRKSTSSQPLPFHDMSKKGRRIRLQQKRLELDISDKSFVAKSRLLHASCGPQSNGRDK